VDWRSGAKKAAAKTDELILAGATAAVTAALSPNFAYQPSPVESDYFLTLPFKCSYSENSEPLR
jgi:hypothetical protein